jgi:hypothetical protein
MAEFRLIPETELIAKLAALRDAADGLIALVERQSGTMRLPSGAGEGEMRQKKKADHAENGKTKTEKARQIIESVRHGGEPHRPKQFDKIGPKISDFVFVLVDTPKFNTADAMEKVREFVILSENRREAVGQVRSAIVRDDRFAKTVDGNWRKKAG